MNAKPHLPRLSVALRCAIAVSFGALIGTAQAQDKSVSAKPDLKRGQQIASTVCSACHAADGNSTIGANPKIAGQSAEYLLKQLDDYSKPATDKAARVNGIMTGILGQVAAGDRLHVAAYYASQAPKPGVARNRDTLELGQRIYRAGVAERAVPACSGCHGPNGAGIPTQYPRLGGQHAEYTESQLKAFRDGTRRNQASMTEIAARLRDAEIAALADYIAGLR